MTCIEFTRGQCVLADWPMHISQFEPFRGLRLALVQSKELYLRAGLHEQLASYIEQDFNNRLTGKLASCVDTYTYGLSLGYGLLVQRIVKGSYDSGVTVPVSTCILPCKEETTSD